MFIERRISPDGQAIELWKAEWENREGHAAKKIYLEKIGDEQPVVSVAKGTMTEAPAICWSYGRTLGNIAVFNPAMVGSFPAKSGSDASLPCDFVNAGRFRHGADRWWCRTHQAYWGTKADLEAYERSKVMACANRDQPMNYVVGPYVLDPSEAAEVGIWCSMPPAISTSPILRRPPKIHVHVRPEVGGKKSIDRDFDAIAIRYGGGLFGNDEITQVNITPPAAFEFVQALEFGHEMGCINCSHCGYPHLDLGDFARKPHRKHFCANCGRDSTWSSGPIVSTPLKPMHDQFASASKVVVPDRVLDLSNYAGCTYTIWASTPAILWTAERPQEQGIHVHVQDAGNQRIVDETFGEVVLNGKPLARPELFEVMASRVVI